MLQADLLRTKDVRATHELVVRVIAGVRAMPGMENATCVLQLESNLAYAAPTYPNLTHRLKWSSSFSTH